MTTNGCCKVKAIGKLALAIAASAFAGIGTADAAGCIRGAVVGGVAGHYAGYHAVAGAVGGSIAGHHLVKKQAEKQVAQKQPARTEQGLGKEWLAL